MSNKQKNWPIKLRNSGIGVTIPGIVMFITGLVLYIVGRSNLPFSYADFTNIDWFNSVYSVLVLVGVILMSLSWSFFLPQGIAMWIVGGVFVLRYRNKK